MKYYNGKKIWITGASSGIGKEMAIQLSSMGAELILSSRNQNALEAVKAICTGAEKIMIIPIDLEDHDGLEKIFQQHREKLSTLDILINNGGISQRSFIEETSFSVYKKLIDVNYLGTLKLTQLLLPFFRKKNSGHILVTSSVAGKFGVPIRAGYSASKFALHGFFEALRAELNNTNIHITMICPGWINTEISKNALKGDGSLQGAMDQGQLEGMPVDIMVTKVLKAAAKKKQEVIVGGIKEAHLGVWLSRMFPSLFRKVIANARVT